MPPCPNGVLMVMGCSAPWSGRKCLVEAQSGRRASTRVGPASQLSRGELIQPSPVCEEGGLNLVPSIPESILRWRLMAPPCASSMSSSWRSCPFRAQRTGKKRSCRSCFAGWQPTSRKAPPICWRRTRTVPPGCGSFVLSSAARRTRAASASTARRGYPFSTVTSALRRPGVRAVAAVLSPCAPSRRCSPALQRPSPYGIR